MTEAVTIDDVARRAGVSRQTVSNVLNAPQVVRESTRQRVMQVVEQLGYSPNSSARRLRTRRSSTIGVRLDAYAGGISGVVLDRFVHALTERAGARRLRVLLYAARTPEDEIARWDELMRGGDVDAVVISGTFHGDPRTGWLLERGLPFVSFGRPWGADDIDDPAHLWVDVDGAAGTRAATTHLLETAGPRVGFLGWPKGSGTGDDRERGWRETIGERAGGESAPRWAVREGIAEARELVTRELARHEIDALVCASDSLAVGAHLAAADLGRPHLPIVGFDNTPVVEALGLSSVEQRPEHVAAAAIDLITGPGGAIEARAATPGAAHALIMPRLIVR
ncbi:MAG TPA: LacI family DNA-binding transcriptional regulator [Microbacterium sp.]|nr:LacI family DNA-binding transcriptional regulator [Microbacterium sp.]